MQPKYQEALNDRGHFEYEITESLRRESTLRKKHDDRVAELAKIREQNNTLEAELIVARARLSNSSIPEVAALERKDEEIRAVKADNERLQRRFNGAQNEVEFMRNQYQEASTAHGGAHRELTGLREEVVAFRTKAQEDKVRIHEIYVESEVQQHLERIKELKAENGELQAELDKKIEELKAASNRRGTRGASVPRSPRMGSATMSPGPQRAIRQVMSNIASGNRSRGSSPAPGEVPPRTQFGEPLFQGPPRTWGNHLQG
jgi:chromosome segregation ATPase